jgi:hypothetical protein
VLPDSFYAQLLAFVAVQTAGWWNMLTGRFRLGFAQFAAGWMLADAALLLRLVAGDAGPTYRLVIVVLQALALVGLGEVVVRRIVRARPGFRRDQEALFAAALDAFMAGRDEEARRGFRRLFRRDPWDAEAATMVATLLARAGERGRALAWFRRARTRARSETLRQRIDEEVRCQRQIRFPRPMPPDPIAMPARPPGRPAAAG